jgi:hypothetical protein
MFRIRKAAGSLLIFSLMVIALLLPIKSFFFASEAERPPHAPSPKLIGGSAVIVLVTVTALLAWVHLQVFAIPPDQLNSWQQLPAPPPNPCKL